MAPRHRWPWARRLLTTVVLGAVLVPTPAVAATSMFSGWYFMNGTKYHRASVSWTVRDDRKNHVTAIGAWGCLRSCSPDAVSWEWPGAKIYSGGCPGTGVIWTIPHQGSYSDEFDRMVATNSIATNPKIRNSMWTRLDTGQRFGSWQSIALTGRTDTSGWVRCGYGSL